MKYGKNCSCPQPIFSIYTVTATKNYWLKEQMNVLCLHFRRGSWNSERLSNPPKIPELVDRIQTLDLLTPIACCLFHKDNKGKLISDTSYIVEYACWFFFLIEAIFKYQEMFGSQVYNLNFEKCICLCNHHAYQNGNISVALKNLLGLLASQSYHHP